MTEPTSHENRAPLVSNLADSIFVGRQREMDELQTILQDALAGRGQMVMLTGEPGVGKTHVSPKSLPPQPNPRASGCFGGDVMKAWEHLLLALGTDHRGIRPTSIRRMPPVGDGTRSHGYRRHHP